MIVIALISAVIWTYLIIARGSFWRSEVIDEPVVEALAHDWPHVVAIVPARNENDVIARSITSLLMQDYSGSFSVVLVDDNSSDGTQREARMSAEAIGAGDRLSILAAAPLPREWTGKLWALSQGIEAASAAAPVYYWLTDADIAYTPDALRTMVMRAQKNDLASVSLMAQLRCESFAERMLIPAFIFFFQMLYPFRWVNHPGSTTAAAAGGCTLVRRAALEHIGGIGAIRGALIDDCTLAARLKRSGGKIWLGLTRRAESIRVYDHFNDIRHMVARSAYAQLRYSPVLLLGTLIGMAVVYVAPPAIVLLGAPIARYVALITWVSMALTFMPILRFYSVSWLWAPFLPVIAGCYMGFTLDSALQHMAGRGGLWKGRVQAPRDA